MEMNVEVNVEIWKLNREKIGKIWKKIGKCGSEYGS